MLILLIPLSLAWLVVAVVVVAACRMAARSDTERTQSARRPSTYQIGRRRILASPQGDRFATYG
jgi:hypothetical protein